MVGASVPAGAAGRPAWPPLPWLTDALQHALRAGAAHALLVHGPAGVGQFDLAMALSAVWLCESAGRRPGDPPCGVCAGCRLWRARSHPDLLVLLPDADRDDLGWALRSADGDEGGDKASRKKPSKEIRVEAIRDAIAFASTTSSRGWGKVVVIHPAERMNPVSANAFLKTLEEPPGAARFVLCTASPDALLPTIRSRCQAISIAVPAADVATAWLAEQGVADPAVLLAACGGQPQEVATRLKHGLDAVSWNALPRRVAAGDAGALRGWPLPMVVDALQKLCHDALAAACGAPPRYFPQSALGAPPALASLLGWARELARVARDADHPWNLELTVETLVEQGREALNTPRSVRAGERADSLHSRR